MPAALRFLRLVSARGLYVVSQFCLLGLLIRTYPAIDIGRYGLALAICGPIFSLAQFDMRLVMSTEHVALRRWHPIEYLSALLASTGAALVLLVGAMCLFADGSTFIGLGLAVALGKSIESFSYGCYGIMQGRSRFVAIARSDLLRGPLTFGVLAAGVSADIPIASVVLLQAGTWLLVLLLHDAPVAMGLLRDQEPHEQKLCARRIVRLLGTILPMGARSVLISLQTNTPRYAVSLFLGNAVLGAFVPVTYLITFWALWFTVTRDYLSPSFSAAAEEAPVLLYQRLASTLKAALPVVLVVYGGSILAGPVLLAAIFGEARPELLPVLALMLLGGAAMSIYTFCELALTVQRRFTAIAAATSISLSMDVLAAFTLVPRYGLLGAAASYTAGACTLLLLGLVLTQAPTGRRLPEDNDHQNSALPLPDAEGVQA